jgi:hypothetical protein
MKLTEEIEKQIAEEFKDLHLKNLDRKYISWGSFMRAGIKIWEKAYNAALDDNNILNEEEAEDFLEKMLKREQEGPSDKQKKLMEEIKKNKEAGYFDVESERDIFAIRWLYVRISNKSRSN